MSYRTSQIRMLCALCAEIAHTKCLRCGRPTCPEHHRQSGNRCEVCEARFAHWRTRALDRTVNWGLPVGPLLALVFSVLVAGPSYDALALFALGCIIGPVVVFVVVVPAIALAARHRFLRQRPP